MSKITVIACSHIIILTGYNQTKRKTEKTEGRSQTRLDYAEVHPVLREPKKQRKPKTESRIRNHNS